MLLNPVFHSFLVYVNQPLGCAVLVCELAFRQVHGYSGLRSMNKRGQGREAMGQRGGITEETERAGQGQAKQRDGGRMAA